MTNEQSNSKSLGYWNSDTFELFAEKTPDKCPECGKKSNFILVRKKPQGTIQITDLFFLRHSCGWEKDITPLELA